MRKFLCSMVVCCLASSLSPGQQPVLNLNANGILIWTNANTNAQFSLEWVPRLGSAWRVWDSYNYSAITSSVMNIEVPMFFRLSLNTNISKFVPPEHSVLIMIGQDTNNIGLYVNSLGIVPAGVMLYTSVQGAEGITNRFEDGGGPQFGQFLANAYSNSVLQIGLYMVGALNGVLAGSYDSNIDFLGAWMANTHRPVYLRIGYEFDADWTGYDPEQYKAAYRYVVDRYASAGISNIAYVWHSQAASARTNRMAWYPGDRYVDWVALSLFGGALSVNRSNIVAVADLARQLRKPLMIAEASPHGITVNGGAASWASWFDPLFEFIRDYDVRALSYINCNWDAPEMWQFNGLGWGEARIQSNPDVTTLWMGKMSNTNYLRASTNLFEILGY